MRCHLLLLAVAACSNAPSPVPTNTSQRAPLADGDHEVDVGDGIRLAYHVHGAGPICIAHPGGPGIGWSYLRMTSAEAHVRIVYLEPLGTGSSTALGDPAKYTFARYADVLDRFRAALGIDKACVIGHSYGGFVAAHWAVTHPDHVGALILYDTGGRSGAGLDPELKEAALAALKSEPWFAGAMAIGARDTPPASDAEASSDLVAEAPLMFADWTHHADAYRAAMGTLRAYREPLLGGEATRTTWDLRDQLARVRAPTLVIVGAKDWITTPARSDELVAAIPGATLVTLPNSSHMGHLEEPQAFATAIGHFVDLLPR